MALRPLWRRRWALSYLSLWTGIGIGMMLSAIATPFLFLDRGSALLASCIATMASLWILGVKVIDMDMGLIASGLLVRGSKDD